MTKAYVAVGQILLHANQIMDLYTVFVETQPPPAYLEFLQVFVGYQANFSCFYKILKKTSIH